MVFGYGFNHLGQFGVFPLMAIVWIFGNLLWIVLVALGIYFLVRALNRRLDWMNPGPTPRGPTREQEDSAVRILRERYARGEIDTEEYQRIRDDLMERR